MDNSDSYRLRNDETKEGSYDMAARLESCGLFV